MLDKIESWLNNFVKYDVKFEEKLSKFHGEIIAFEVIDLGKKWSIQLCETHIHLNEGQIPSANVTVKGSCYDFISFIIGSVVGTYTFNLNIEGDQELMYEFKMLFSSLNIEWEECLAQWIGDGLSHDVGRMVKKASQSISDFETFITTQLSEYIQHESRMVPGKEEMIDFFDDIDELSQKLERLEAKLKRIKV